MGDIKNFDDIKTKQIVKSMRKLWEDFENMSPEAMMTGVYKKNLYFYSCGQAGMPNGYYHGWLSGVEYMFEYMGIDYKELRKQVRRGIEDEGRQLINNEFFIEERVTEPCEVDFYYDRSNKQWIVKVKDKYNEGYDKYYYKNNKEEALAEARYLRKKYDVKPGRNLEGYRL